MNHIVPSIVPWLLDGFVNFASPQFEAVALRPLGELAVTHRERGVKLVLAPPGSPISVIYRNGERFVKLAETSKTGE